MEVDGTVGNFEAHGAGDDWQPAICKVEAVTQVRGELGRRSIAVLHGANRSPTGGRVICLRSAYIRGEHERELKCVGAEDAVRAGAAAAAALGGVAVIAAPSDVGD